MVKFHVVSLSEVERMFLRRTMTAGTAPARVTKRARVLLKADAADDGPGWEDAVIAEATQVSIPTIERWRKRAVTEGVEAAISDHPRPPRGGTLDGAQEEMDRRFRLIWWKWLVYLGSLGGAALTFLGIAALIPVPILRYVVAAVAAFLSLNSWAALVILIAWPLGQRRRRE